MPHFTEGGWSLYWICPIHPSAHMSVDRVFGAYRKSTGSMSLGIHTCIMNPMTGIDFSLDCVILDPLVAIIVACNWNLHRFCIPASDWWKIVTRAGICCPHLWTKLVTIKTYLVWLKLNFCHILCKDFISFYNDRWELIAQIYNWYF